MIKRIECNKCQKYLGEIRVATLRRGVVYYCRQCQEEIETATLNALNPFSDYFLKEIFKTGK